MFTLLANADALDLVIILLAISKPAGEAFRTTSQIGKENATLTNPIHASPNSVEVPGTSWIQHKLYCLPALRDHLLNYRPRVDRKAFDVIPTLPLSQLHK